MLGHVACGQDVGVASRRALLKDQWLGAHGSIRHFYRTDDLVVVRVADLPLGLPSVALRRPLAVPSLIRSELMSASAVASASISSRVRVSVTAKSAASP